MPRKINSSPPPKVMTWARASPVLALCVIFDAARAFFNMFWFFGPAFATVYCTSKLGEWVGSLWGLTAAACAAAGGITGTLGLPITIAFGTIMAMVVGFIGWLTVFLIQLLMNIDIFKENFAMIIRYAVGLLLGEIPIVNTLPSLTPINIIMFRRQIKKGKEELQKWKEENKERQRQVAEKRQQQQAAATEFMQNQAMQQQAANDEQYTNEEIPEEGRKAA